METPGNRLREARIERSLSLEDVANVTRIPRQSLEHLEENRLDKLPAPVFVRGFIRAYARTVGLEAAEIVRLFDLAQREDSSDEGRQNESRARTVRPIRTATSHGSPGMLRGGYALLGAVVLGLLIAAWALVGNKTPPSEASAYGTPSPVMHERIDGIRDIGAETPIRLR